MKIRRYISFFGIGLLAAVGLLSACAKQGYPTGGPKDEKPPVVLGTTPPNGTINFTAKEFLISFDEYVQVKSADENILVSPPMKHKPEYGTKGRGILVKIKDTLRENTTYLFQFKEGIADYNEGNLLKSFEYVFSTGASIDSMTIRGRVADAFTDKPWKETVTVVAYAAPCDDSVAAKEHPLYMTRCDKEGNFELNHLRAGRYRLLAYEDGDKNLRLGTGEAAAFLDTLVAAQKMPPPPDTSTKDTAAVRDSVATDSVSVGDSATTVIDTALPPTAIVPVMLRISLFKQETQRVVKCEFKRKGFLEIATMCPLSDSCTVKRLGGREGDLFVRANRTRDTLRLWTAQEACDSITLLLTDTNLRDTLKLQWRERNTGKAIAPPPGVKSSIIKSLANASHPYFDTLEIGFENPVADSMMSQSDSVVRVFNFSDSTTSYCGVKPAHDLSPSGSSRAMIDFVGRAGVKYRFTILPNHFTDIYRHTNADSLHINTEFTKVESYGNIILDVEADGAADSAAGRVPLLIQLTNEKGDVLQQRVVTDRQKLTFSNLKGGKYCFRAIFDRDGNRQWTAGDYWKGRQPERVVNFEKVLELRENWDMEERWRIAYN